jgi:hypothetical protein
MIWMLAAALSACGGGSGGGGGGTTPPPFVPVLSGLRISASSPFSPGCDAATATGTLYQDAEVEPIVAVSAFNPANIIAAWQQDRWSDGGSHGLVTAASFDGGQTWTRASPAVAHCAGGTGASDYQRASDPWLSFAADGSAYLLSLSFSGATLAPGSGSAMLVAHSTDGGAHWDTPMAVIADGENFFNDKGSISADPVDAQAAYVVWDRLSSDNHGASYFARTRNAGQSWETPLAVYDPGAGNQTIGNLLVGLPGGALLLVFTELDAGATGTSATLKAMRSNDQGDTWDAPVSIAQERTVGTRDPVSGAAVRDGSQLPSVAVDHAGVVYVVWQDSRFSAGQRDGIALARSLDGGVSWSAPVQVNGAPAVPAFTPVVQVRGDGVIGVSYYDLRNNPASGSRLVTDYWLATSTDALSWQDTHLSGPFSLAAAPNAEGLFLGDYQGLAVSGNDFLPVFVAVTGDNANRTDVYIAPSH